MAGDDIVARLRGHIAITTRIHYAKDGYHELVYVHGPSPICQEAADEIERLRAERDEARRMLCEEWAKQDGLPLDWQGRRGAEGMAEFVKWDCFKEASDER